MWDTANETFYQALSPKVKAAVELNKNQRAAELVDKKKIKYQKAKFEYELYIKYSFAAVCFIFIFIGAPLGAIIRKGGYGYPLIICILVFIVYVMLNTFCKKLTEGLRIPTFWAAWLPCIILTIPGIILTWSAIKDRNALFEIRQYFILWFKKNKS
jgi:lipopolysaccharide export system permease protein